MDNSKKKIGNGYAIFKLISYYLIFILKSLYLLKIFPLTYNNGKPIDKKSTKKIFQLIFFFSMAWFRLLSDIIAETLFAILKYLPIQLLTRGSSDDSLNPSDYPTT